MTRALHCKWYTNLRCCCYFTSLRHRIEIYYWFIFSLSGYAHFILGRQYWKFDPVGMNSLEGYPRYVGMDFFGCRNVWVFNQWRIRLTEFFCFLFQQWRGGIWNWLLCVQGDKIFSLMFYSIYWCSDQFHHLLRKTKVSFLRHGTSCAATFIFILHVLSPIQLRSGPSANHSSSSSVFFLISDVFWFTDRTDFPTQWSCGSSSLHLL